MDMQILSKSPLNMTPHRITLVNDDSWHGSWTSSVDQKICDSCRNDVPLQAVLEAPCGNIPILAQPEEVELNLQTGDTSVQTEFTGH